MLKFVGNFRSIFLISLIVGFLLAGIIGHDPWKQDETYTFGIIYHFYTTHSWLVPVNAGAPFMEKPPLYYWSATVLCKLLGPWVALHDAARLASFFYMLVTSWFFWKTTGVLLAKEERRQEVRLTALLLFLGTAGVVRHSHDMFTDVALLAGSAIALYGVSLLTCCNIRWKEAGLWLGLGAGIAFLTKGLFVPAILGMSLLAVVALLPSLRTLRTLNAVLLAAVVVSPFLVVWPLLLYQYSPALFIQWFWENNVGRFLGFSVPELGANNELGYVLYSAFWFAFPVFPLAVLRLVRRLRGWRRGVGVTVKPEWLLPVCISVIGLFLLVLSASARALYLLPLIPALAVLGAREVFALPVRLVAGWNHAVRVLFFVLIFLLWSVWIGLINGYAVYAVAQQFPVGFMPQGSQWFAVLAALAATACFLYTFRLKARENSSVAPIWFAGVAGMWIVGMALLLPWGDETRSYRPVLMQMQAFIEHSPYRGLPMEEYRMGESIGPMLEYFIPGQPLRIVPHFGDAHAPLLFTVEMRSEHVQHGPQWKLVWHGSRVLDTKDEELRLYVRNR